MAFAAGLGVQQFTRTCGDRWRPKQQGDRRREIGLVVFDDHQIVAALRQDLAGNRLLGQQRIHGRHGAGQVAASQQQRYSRDFVGFLGHGCLAQDISVLMAHQTDQKGAFTVRSGAPDIFAIDGLTTEDLPIAHRDAADGRIGAIEGLVVGGDLLFQAVDINMRHQPSPGGDAGHPRTSGLQSRDQLGGMLIRPVSHRQQGGLARGHGGGNQGQQIRPGETLATGFAKVGNLV